MNDGLLAARRAILIAVIGAAGLVLAAVVPPVLDAVIDAVFADNPSCTQRLLELNELSEELKDVYAQPGDPPDGVPALASADELDDWKVCGGDPEQLLEAAAGN